MVTKAALTEAAIAGAQLQNAYALAVDTRDWAYFATLFTPEVLATYPNREYDGMDDWLSHFIPFHDECTWTLHVMSNNVVGADDHGLWAACHGAVQWCHSSQPGEINRASVHFRDRLVNQDGRWLIGRRRLDLLMIESDQLPSRVSLPNSLPELVDRS